MKHRRCFVFAAMFVCMISSFSQAAAWLDDFTGPTLGAQWNTDIPNPGVASASINTGAGTLELTTTGSTDMWNARNNAPIVWTAAPTGIYSVETRVGHTATNNSVSGITVYDNVDGSLPVFSFGLDHWGGSQKVKLQGLGNNNPSIESPHASTVSSWNGMDASLKMTVIPASVSGAATDRYLTWYRHTDSDAWTPLGEYIGTVPNDRVGLFTKTGGAKTASFDYFSLDDTVATASTAAWQVDIQGTNNYNSSLPHTQTLDSMNGFWNYFEVTHYNGNPSVNPSMTLADSGGLADGVTFSVTGDTQGNPANLQGYNNAGDPLVADYLFIRAGSSSENIDWEITGLDPGEEFEFIPYSGSGSGRQFDLAIDADGDGAIDDDGLGNPLLTMIDADGEVFSVTSDATGKIVGQTLNRGAEGNWAGFTLQQLTFAVIPEPMSLAIWLLGGMGLFFVAKRRRR